MAFLSEMRWTRAISRPLPGSCVRTVLLRRAVSTSFGGHGTASRARAVRRLGCTTSRFARRLVMPVIQWRRTFLRKGMQFQRRRGSSRNSRRPPRRRVRSPLPLVNFLGKTPCLARRRALLLFRRHRRGSGARPLRGGRALRNLECRLRSWRSSRSSLIVLPPALILSTAHAPRTTSLLRDSSTLLGPTSRLRRELGCYRSHLC